MATDNRLRAQVPPSHAEHIDNVARDISADEYGPPRTAAERRVIEEGLASLGYVSRPTDGPGLWLYYVRFIGQALGLAGLASLALGVFWGQLAGIYGFSLLMLGFLIVVTGDAIRIYTERRGPSA